MEKQSEQAGSPDPPELDQKKIREEKKKREKESKLLQYLDKQKKNAALKEQSTINPSKKKKEKMKSLEDTNPDDYINPETPLNEKKRLSKQMANAYNPRAVECSWYDWWKNQNLFKSKNSSKKPPFTMILPPPNVTGALHIGHALTAAVQDTIIRWRRMSGDNVSWIPGMDHAGIATQVVVEKKLMRERNQSRHDLSPEEFIKEVWKWKDSYGGTILKQLTRLGASLDWDREFFTMDEQRSRAVTEAFVKLYEEGLIYRDNRLVNWDCSLRTAISDIEIEYEDIKDRKKLKVPGYENEVEFGVLTSFHYPIEGDDNNEEEYITVATTRVETMLGDTAVAVHPKDERFKRFHGRFAIHPFNGRRLPIIQDDKLVDMNFGTGAVKITPAHDENDFEVGIRHGLEFINIFTDDGRINSNGGEEFEGMLRYDARAAIIEGLKKKGLHHQCVDNEMRIGVCTRSNDVIEPLIKPQWYLKCDGMAKEALKAVEKGEMEIIPKKYGAEWKRWLDNIHDWCISRQILWGHQIPAWYAVLEDDEKKEIGSYKDHWVVSRDAETAKNEVTRIFPGKQFRLSRDPDVLDTWFSSGLLPLSTLGWPEDTNEFKTLYPNSVLETGHDILFFWVARMVMMGMKLSDDNKVPFRKVYLHPMIRDKNGRKMSKSLGNVVDPLEVIEGITLDGLIKRLGNGILDPSELNRAKIDQAKDFPHGIPECGSDALRFSLVSYTAQSDKINLDILRVVGYREWCNKLWNATRFALTKLGDDYIPNLDIYSHKSEKMPFSCQWILSMLNKTITTTISSLEAYKFSHAASAIYDWWKDQLCDVFIELIKPYFFENGDPEAKKHAQDTLWVCFDTGLKLLHPFMPYITEELWQRLPAEEGRKESIMISDYPSAVEIWKHDSAEEEMDLVKSIKSAMRSLIPLTEKSGRRGFIMCSTDLVEVLQKHEFEILTLSSLTHLEVSADKEIVQAAECTVQDVVDEKVTVFLEIKRAVDVEAQEKKMEDAQKQLEKSMEKMENEGKLPALKLKLESIKAAKLYLGYQNQ